jgi:hypothetical protein
MITSECLGDVSIGDDGSTTDGEGDEARESGEFNDDPLLDDEGLEGTREGTGSEWRCGGRST